MKSQIKRFSKSTLSVILSLCMLVSCMTVGIIATDAAYDNGEGVGYDWNGGTYYMKGSFNGWGVLSGTNNSSNTQQHYYYIYTNGSSTDSDITFKFKEEDGSGKDSWFGAGNTDSIGTTGKTIYENGGENIHLNRKNLGTTSTTWYKVKVWFEHAGTCYCWYEKDTTKTALTPTLSTKKDSTSTDSFDVGDTVSLSTSTTNNFGTVTYTYQYKIGDGTYQDISGTSFTPSAAGTYTIKVTANDSAVVQGTNSESARTATDEKTITVSNPTYTIAGEVGLTGGTAWDPANTDNDMVLSDSSYTKTFYNIAAGTYKFKIVKNHSWDEGDIGYSNNVSSDGLVTDVSPEVGDGSNIVFTTSGSANITITFTPTSTIVINAVSNLTPLDAPTNIKLNNASSDLTVDTTVVGAKIRLSWDTVANAGTYKVYKGETLVDTVSTLFYDIERAYSSTGTYTVVAVPSDDNTYIESPKSTGLTLTVNKSKLNKPTISVQPTDIKTGSSVELTVTDTNTGFTASQFNYYYYTGSSVSIDNNHLMTPGVAKTLSPTSDTTYKACAYPVNGENNDYYLQSDTEEANVVYVSTPAWYLTGDLVTGQGGSSGWPTQITTYPVNTFVSHNVFYRSVTVSGGAATAKHYFRLTNQTNQYGNGSDTDMAAYDGSTTAKKLPCNTTGTSGAMYVTGNGTFKIYVDQSSSSEPKVWVVNNEWSITSTAYYQTYNLTNDAYNAAQEGTTGGTVSGDVEVVKGTSTTLTATPATGYAFDGWYSNTDLAAAHKVYSNASYTFTPSANGDYYALFKKIVNRYNVELSFTSTQANVSATYHGTTISTNGAKMSVPEGATVTYSISAKTGAQIDSVSPSSLSTGTNKTFTMPSAARTITVTSSWKEYTLTRKVSPEVTPAHGTLKFYEDGYIDNNGNIDPSKEITTATATYQQEFWVVYVPNDDYVLKNFTVSGQTQPTMVGTLDRDNNRAKYRMGAHDAIFTANVMLQYNVNYYIDLHNTDMSENKKVKVEVVDSSGNIVQKANGKNCDAELSKKGDSTVYWAEFETPFKQQGSGYDSIYFKIYYNNNLISTETLNSEQVAKLKNTKEVWLEAVNEESLKTTVYYRTKTETTVANGYRRIYLARPYSWCYTENNQIKGSDTDWNNIGIYYWGSTYGENNGWEYGDKLTKLGSDADYTYYSVDIPKYLPHTWDGNTVNDSIDYLIFQGWANNTREEGETLNPSAQTVDIYSKNNSTDNYFVLGYDGDSITATAEDSVTIPDYTRYVNEAKMNVTLKEGEEAKVNPSSYNGEKVMYISSDTGKVTVDGNGKLTPIASGNATITVRIFGTIGKRLYDYNSSINADYRDIEVSVTINDPGKLNSFELVSLESAEYTVNIPKVGENSNVIPGYFDMSEVKLTVTGIKGLTSSTTSAIVTESSKDTVVVDGKTYPTSFTVKYAKSMDSDNFDGYDGITLTGDITTKSIRREGANRYGLAGTNPWKSYLNDQNETVVNCTTSKSVTNGQETVLSKNIEFSTSFDTYSAIFEEYQYVDVTFVYDYYEYVPQIDNKDTPYDTSDDMVYYQYQPEWAGANGRFESGFNTDSAHNVKKTYTVSAFEVRDVVKSDLNNGNTSIAEKKLKLLVSGATAAIGVMPSNNYYSYSINGSTQVIPKTEIEQVSGNNYAVKVYVHMDHSPQTYSVYLNGTLNNGGSVNGKYYYQESAVLNHPTQTANKVTMWYAVEEDATEIVPETDPLLATGDGYEFRVKGDTYIRTQEADDLTEETFNRSEVDFSHYEVQHRDNPQNEIVDYLLQNFYIADFFDPNKVFATRTIVGSDNTEEYKPEDPQFVGGGVVYFSVDGTSKLPRSSNAVGLGYVNSDGTLNKNAVKEMLKSEILSSVNNTNYNGCGVTDFETLSNTIGEQDALKVAYGTEIDAHQYVENNIKTGVLYRYLPLETFSNDSNKWDSSTGTPLKDDKQNYYTTLNNNTFRYSNTLQSYQYVYASGNENKETNNGRDMRLYSYYVYSYVAYNQETNVPETKYEIVLSDNYSDASTYWAGNPNPNPAN